MTPCLPDYSAGSLLNLMASLIRARGGRSPHPDLRELPAKTLRPVQRWVYLVIDGLGWEQLGDHLAEGEGCSFFAVHPRRRITAVAPATTAAAVTTLATGASPAEHGLLGWHLLLPDLGLVSTILKASTRTGSPVAPPGFDLDAYLRIPSHLATTSGRRELITQADIARSRYCGCGTSWHRCRAYRVWGGLVRQILAYASHGAAGLAYAYWPHYDTLCHREGCRHRAVRSHFREMDVSLGRLAARLGALDTGLLVTADHGLEEVGPDGCVDLSRVPGLFDCLSMLPSGDARLMHCFVREGRGRAFEAIVDEWLAPFCVSLRGSRVLENGWFGPGRPHPALARRTGDRILLAREGRAMSVSVPGLTKKRLRAYHGGLSAREMYVPLYVLPP